MAKGIEIGIASETRAFKQGVDAGIIEPVENAVDALDELGKAEGLEQLEEGFEDAQDASKRLQRETKDAADEIERGFREAYRELKNSAEDGTDEASEGMETMQSRGERAAGRIAGTFDGSFEGIASGAQRLAGTAFAGFGPAGVLAGAAAAAGLGLVTSEIEKQQKAADALKEYFRNAYQAAAEAGRTYIDQAQVDSEVLRIMFDEDQTRYNTAAIDARNLGLSVTEVVRAQAGDQDALNHVMEVTAQKEQERLDKLNEATTAQDRRASIMTAENQTLDEISSRYGTLAKLTEDNAQKAQEYLDYQNKTATAVDLTNAALGRTPKSIPVALTPDTSAIDSALRNSRVLNVEVNAYLRNGLKVF